MTCSQTGCWDQFTGLKKLYDHFVSGPCRKSNNPTKKKVILGTVSNAPVSSSSSGGTKNQSCCLCPFCAFRCPDKLLTRRHILQHYGQRFARCCHCREEFLALGDVERHSSVRHPGQPVHAQPIIIVRPVQILSVDSLELLALDGGDYTERKPHERKADQGDVYTCKACAFSTDLAGAASHHGQHAHQYASPIQLCAAAPDTGQPIIICPYCPSLKSTDEDLVLTHMAGHRGVQLKRCYHCPLEFPKFSQMRQHCATAHPRLKYRCEIGTCRILPMDGHRLVLVKRDEYPEHSPGGAYGCDDCQFTTDSIDVARQHGQHAHEKAAIIHSPGLRKRDPPAVTVTPRPDQRPAVSGPPLLPKAECVACGVILTGTATWCEHEAQHPEWNLEMDRGPDNITTSFQCMNCAFVGSTMMALLRHLHSFHPNKSLAYQRTRHYLMFQCPKCPVEVSSIPGLKSHVAYHAPRYKCGYCSKTAIAESSMVQHCANKHQDRPVKVTANFRVDTERLRLERMAATSQGRSVDCGQQVFYQLGVEVLQGGGNDTAQSASLETAGKRAHRVATARKKVTTYRRRRTRSLLPTPRSPSPPSATNSLDSSPTRPAFSPTPAPSSLPPNNSSSSEPFHVATARKKAICRRRTRSPLLPSSPDSSPTRPASSPTPVPPSSLPPNHSSSSEPFLVATARKKAAARKRRTHSPLLPSSPDSSPSGSASLACSSARPSSRLSVATIGISDVVKCRKRRAVPAQSKAAANRFAALLAARTKRKRLSHRDIPIRPSSSTTTCTVDNDPGFSAYGRRPDSVDWDRITVRTNFRRVQNAIMNGQHFREVFNLNAVVMVVDAATAISDCESD